MASSLEMFLSGLALLINTLVILTMYFVMNVTIGPVLKFAGDYFAANPPPIDMSSITYIFSAIFFVLIALEVVFIIAFVAVIFRRETVGWDEPGGIA
jgi:hypothetical protein